MSYEAKVLADSVAPCGIRLTTVQVTFPRFILAEVNTHRVFSRNSASSRAIPPEKLIDKVKLEPFVPETFNARVKGMGVGEELDGEKLKFSKQEWLAARNDAVRHAEMLNHLGVDKSRINRLLEPFMWHTAIITSTQWENFFALRAPAGEKWTKDFDAQPEFQITAIVMRRAMRESEPVELDYGTWHLPLVTEETRYSDPPRLWWWPMVSAGRCARVSFDTHENYEEPEKSYERAVRLKSSGHLSPFEHPATPLEGAFGLHNHDWCGNLEGWRQYRKLIAHEDNFKRYTEELEHEAAAEERRSLRPTFARFKPAKAHRG